MITEVCFKSLSQKTKFYWFQGHTRRSLSRSKCDKSVCFASPQSVITGSDGHTALFLTDGLQINKSTFSSTFSIGVINHGWCADILHPRDLKCRNNMDFDQPFIISPSPHCAEKVIRETTLQVLMKVILALTSLQSQTHCSTGWHLRWLLILQESVAE